MNIQKIREDFPVFSHNPTITYLDSAATSLTPTSVINATVDYYTKYNANIARGAYKMSVEATQKYEDARTCVADFVNAEKEEIVFTSGTTMSLNMIAHGLQNAISEHDEIITTQAEHHANFIPWQELCKKNNARFLTIPVTEEGEIDQIVLKDSITKNTKIVALSHVSNVLGTINPIKALVAEIRAINPDTLIVIDAAQSAPHIKIDVKDIDCDFLAFSLHKMFGPTGVGVLYGKKEKLEMLEPLITGGEMIASVSSEKTTFRDVPHRLEAGTPNIANVIASQAAITYLQKYSYEEIRQHEIEILKYAIKKLQKTFGEDISIIGTDDVTKRSGILSFTFNDYHPHDIASILDENHSIAIRAGQHCAMPLHLESLETNATARISISIYNSKSDIDALINGLKEVTEILK